MTKFERFITENPQHPLVVRLVKLTDRMAMNSGMGKLYAEVSRLADEVYA